ncbi:hypothetical protein GCM10010116_01000 [Microbispora rosea subsp. aerata]|nr:hypothetical protein [Microbispora rosea]GGO00643.1 hypothetical protein GCM10010116_01000 [Microbispora rosea subsp. aerata]GIH56852.1 hypothetical protein Mro02_37660 [Microbispora rosea subsp. aerata]GLJ84336.1 hypothetical protein GCM10017588_30640 [Microbispora rosea subsp. aerata]
MAPQIVAAVYAVGALVFLAPAAPAGETAAPEREARPVVARDAVIPALPWPGPRCPERAPEGWEFAGAGVPDFGLPYDVYRRLRPDGAYEYRRVYCV